MRVLVIMNEALELVTSVKVSRLCACMFDDPHVQLQRKSESSQHLNDITDSGHLLSRLRVFAFAALRDLTRALRATTTIQRYP